MFPDPTIMDGIKRLIETEDRTKPLGDQKLVALLGRSNFKVPRRAVTKYREMLGYSGSAKRKRYF